MGILILVLVIIALILLVLVVFFISIYNQLIQLRVNIDKSWSNIDVLQKQRYDEIPKLINVCEGYMKYERETLEKITQVRTQFLSAKTPSEIAKIDTELTTALKTLFAVVENYPELKSNQNFLQLQTRITYLENQIADRREFYNDSVTVYNTRIQQVPYVFVAKLLNYAPKEMYKITEQEKNSPEIKFELPK